MKGYIIRMCKNKNLRKNPHVVPKENECFPVGVLWFLSSNQRIYVFLCMFFMVAQNHWGEYIYEKSQLFNYSHESELDIVSTE